MDRRMVKRPPGPDTKRGEKGKEKGKGKGGRKLPVVVVEAPILGYQGKRERSKASIVDQCSATSTRECRVRCTVYSVLCMYSVLCTVDYSFHLITVP
jgi:hypothetical protein